MHGASAGRSFDYAQDDETRKAEETVGMLRAVAIGSTLCRRGLFSLAVILSAAKDLTPIALSMPGVSTVHRGPTTDYRLPTTDNRPLSPLHSGD